MFHYAAIHCFHANPHFPLTLSTVTRFPLQFRIKWLMTGAQGDPITTCCSNKVPRVTQRDSHMKGPLLIVRFIALHNVQIDLQPYVKYLK